MKVDNIEDYWVAPPPHPSTQLIAWLDRFAKGWKPNRRISSMGYYESAEWYGVYIWEYLHVIAGHFSEHPGVDQYSWDGSSWKLKSEVIPPWGVNTG